MPNSLDNSETMTAGEVYRIAKDLKDTVKGISDKLDSYPTMRDVAYLENRVKDLESWHTWTIRIGVPALIAVVTNSILNLDQLIGS